MKESEQQSTAMSAMRIQGATLIFAVFIVNAPQMGLNMFHKKCMCYQPFYREIEYQAIGRNLDFP